MHEFRHDMDEIGKKVVAFLPVTSALGEDPALAASFVADLEARRRRAGRPHPARGGHLHPLYAPVS